MFNAYVRESFEDGQRYLVVQLSREDPSSVHAVGPDMRNQIDLPRRFIYLDVGAWIGDDSTQRKRNFGVIYGNGREGWVVLCERPPLDEFSPVYRMPGDFRHIDVNFTNTLLDFIRHCHSHIVGRVARDRMLNTGGEIYVILGDIHLPLINANTPLNLIENIPRKWMNLNQPNRFSRWRDEVFDTIFYDPDTVRETLRNITDRDLPHAPNTIEEWRSRYIDPESWCAGETGRV